MLNQFMVIGKIEGIQEDEIHHRLLLHVSSRKAFLSEEGELKEDHFQLEIWKGIWTECLAIAKVGQYIAAKGRLESHVEHGLCLMVEKLSYFPMV